LKISEQFVRAVGCQPARQLTPLWLPGTCLNCDRTVPSYDDIRNHPECMKVAVPQVILTFKQPQLLLIILYEQPSRTDIRSISRPPSL
jgi:hypothetical protein